MFVTALQWFFTEIITSFQSDFLGELRPEMSSHNTKSKQEQNAEIV
jgi:hypothetical protein